MNNKKIITVAWYIVVFLGVLLLLFTFFYVFQKDQIPSVSSLFSATTANLLGQSQGSPGLPNRLIIPSIDVDAGILSLGLTKEKNMDAPKNLHDVGWFNLGVRPGDTGSAVIDGHLGLKGGNKGVFARLRTLKVGDSIIVKDNEGVSISFAVTNIATYESKANTKDVFISTDGKAHLNLITCDGDYDPVSKSYNKRTVVFTERVID
jgi:LPXTG-site transpeptidase (sortase) family protein